MSKPEFYEKIRSSVLISEIVRKKVSLRKAGNEFMGLCPFHKEKSPSFTVSDQKGFYHCFGCQEHGDIIKFHSSVNAVSYHDAAVEIANIYNISVPQERVHQINKKFSQEHSTLDKICKKFELNLMEPSGREAFSYIKQRGITDSACKKFRLGFAKNSYDDIVLHLQSLGISQKEILSTGIIALSQASKKPYDKLRNRVVFPIEDDFGNIVGFGGRVLNKDDKPKYLNSAETKIFEKGKLLYNFRDAKKHAYDPGYLILVEGYMDVISLWDHNIKNVVAGLGTACTAEQVKKIFLATDKLIVCLDSDNAGINAAKKICDTLLPLVNSRKTAEFVFLKGKTDPDEFIKKNGVEAFIAEVKNAKPLSSVMFSFALIEFGITEIGTKVSPELKAKIESGLSEKLNNIVDPLTKKHFFNFFRREINFFSYGKKHSESKQMTNMSENHTNITVCNSIELEVLSLIVRFPELLEFCKHLELVDLRGVEFENFELAEAKENLIDAIDCTSLPDLDVNTQRSLLEKSLKANRFSFSAKLSHFFDNTGIDLESAKLKIELLLLKHLLLTMESQYKLMVSDVDQIKTTDTQVQNQRIEEFVLHRNSVEKKISEIEEKLL